MSEWHNKQEATNKIGIKIIIGLYKLFGYRSAKLSLYPVAAYYFITRRSARQASTEYLNQISDYCDQIKPNLCTSFKHFLAFAESILDQFLIWLEQPPNKSVSYNNEGSVVDLIKKRQGFVLLSAHLGNLVVCQYLSSLRPNLKINIIVHLEHAKQFNRLLDRYRSHQNIHFYQASNITPATAGELFEKSQIGEVVVMAADRIPVNNNDRVQTVDFLKRPADLPQGPFILSGLLGCPVYTLFCLKVNGRYCMHFDLLTDKIDMRSGHRDKEITTSIKKFGQLLEKYCQIAPLQWFNFYPFWLKK